MAPREVVFIVYPGLQGLDLVGPAEVFAGANRELGRDVYRLRTAAVRPGVVPTHGGLGLVADVFHENVIRRLEGNAAIGHNRYSTAGETLLRNTQPLVAEFSLGSLAVCHNGNFVNAAETPLMHAARSGSVEAVKTLLAAGAAVDAKEAWNGQTALM